MESKPHIIEVPSSIRPATPYSSWTPYTPEISQEKGIREMLKHKRKNSVFRIVVSNQFYCKDNRFSNIFFYILVSSLTWTVIFFFLNKDVLPSGDLFKLFSLVIVAYFFGEAVLYIRMPPILGMLFTGVIFRYIGFFQLVGAYENFSAAMRDICLSIILVKGGLTLEAAVLGRLGYVILKLAICPCIMESISAAAGAHFILGLPASWSLLLGCSMSPVSSAYLVPALMSLKNEGYGEDKGIVTLIIAASSIDDFVSISFLGISLATVITEKKWLTVLYGPMELMIGVLAGMLYGFITTIIPNKQDKNFVVKRTIIITIGGMCAILGGRYFGFPTSGQIFCITECFISNHAAKYQNISSATEEMKTIYTKLSIVALPIYFSLMGTEIDLSHLQFQQLSSGLYIVLSCLLIRVATSFVSLMGVGLNWKEKIFINLAWLPKATVKISLSPLALDLLKKQEHPMIMQDLMKSMLLTISVMAVIAPLGSVAVTLFAPYLLQKESKQNAIA